MPDPDLPSRRAPRPRRGHLSGAPAGRLRMASPQVTTPPEGLARRGPAMLAAAALAALAACSSGSGGSGGQAGSGACAAPSTAPPAQVALLPDGMSFEEVGPVTHVVSTDGHLTVRAVTTLPLDEATVEIQDAVTAAGYRPAGMDNEGFEAEVFFTSGSYAAGQAIVRASDCEGRWDVDLVLIDPDAVPSPGASSSASSNTGSSRSTSPSPSPTASPSAG